MTTQKNYTVAIHTPSRIVEVGKSVYSSYDEALVDAEYASFHGTNTFDEKFLRQEKEIGSVVTTITDNNGDVVWSQDFKD